MSLREALQAVASEIAARVGKYWSREYCKFFAGTYYTSDLDDWDQETELLEATLASDHCIARLQTGKFRPKEYSGRIVRFSTWASTVMRRKLHDSREKEYRATLRTLRHEVKRARRDAQNASETRQELKKKCKRDEALEKLSDQLKEVGQHLKPSQAELLKLKSRGLSNVEIAERLGVTQPQLRNRWCRLKKIVKRKIGKLHRQASLVQSTRERWHVKIKRYAD